MILIYSLVFVKMVYPIELVFHKIDSLDVSLHDLTSHLMNQILRYLLLQLWLLTISVDLDQISLQVFESIPPRVVLKNEELVSEKRWAYATISTSQPKECSVTLTSSTSGSSAAGTQLSSYVVRSVGMVKFFCIMRMRQNRIKILIKALGTRLKLF